MSATSRHAGGGSQHGAELVLLWGAIAIVGVGGGLVAAAVHLGAELDHSRHALPGNPFTLLFGLADGSVRWPSSATTVLIAFAAFLVLLAIVVAVLYSRHRRGRSRVDRAASRMGRGRDVAGLGRRQSNEKAKRLGVSAPGLPIGRTIAGNQPLYASWEDVCIDISGPRTGKALRADTPVLTPHGWVTIRDLARGCQVIGADGRPTVVTGVYPQGVRPAYRLHCGDHTSVVCDGDHIWRVRSKIRNDHKHAEQWRNWTTSQMLENGLRRKSGGAKYYLPIVDPVQFAGVLPEGRPLELIPPRGRGLNVQTEPKAPAFAVAPYLLGVLIGDGGLCSGSVRLSTAEAPDMIPMIAPLLPKDVTAKPVKGSDYDWALTSGRAGRRNPLTAALRTIGLLGHSSLTKFIPQQYLLADIESRRALLAGLMDTDGSVDTRGSLEFSTSSPLLSEGFRFLVQSLGGTVTTTRRVTSHAASYRSNVRLPRDAAAPFRLARKRARWDAAAPLRRLERPVRPITAIEREDDAEMVCISVAAEDGLFVVEHCIVTHNTTSTAIPMLLAAPGAAVVTSNKRDIVDATRDLRADVGDVFVFDPQGLVDEPPDWWWNPLSFVTDEVKAGMLADIFASASRDPSARTDAYFEPAGTELMANLLLAAALGKEAITQVYLWLANPIDDEPVAILRDHGYDILAAALQGVINLPEKQRAGIYGTAKQMGSFLTNRQAVTWVTPDAGRSVGAAVSEGANPWVTKIRREFHPHEFVRGSGTLYSVSKEGVGSAGPLVTALTVAVLEAAEDLAKRSPGGRLKVPLVAVLDEAANTVRFRHLGSQYSHWGSRGIVVMTILQSWSQGVEVWGRDGMRKLWSAANVKIYGGGVAEVEFLNELSQLVGDYNLTTTSVSYGRGGRSTNRAVRRERVLDVADLTALPKGRTVVFASGAPATLVKRVPWMQGPDAERISASIRAHDPAAEQTLAAAVEGAELAGSTP